MSQDGHTLTEEGTSIFEAMESSENGGQGIHHHEAVALQKLEEPADAGTDDSKEEALSLKSEEIPLPPPPPAVPVSLSEETDVHDVEFVQTEMGGAERPTDKELEVESITQETDHVIEAVHVSVGMDAPSSQMELPPPPPPPEETTEPAASLLDVTRHEVVPTTDVEVAIAPLPEERRRSLFNCCGLLDVLMGGKKQAQNQTMKM